MSSRCSVMQTCSEYPPPLQASFVCASGDRFRSLECVWSDFSAILFSICGMSHSRMTKVSAAFTVLAASLKMSHPFSPYVTSIISYTAALRHDRQMSMLRKLMGCRLCLLLRCDKTVRHQLKGYMANQSWTWLGAATTTNQQCWWGLVLEALSGESTRACFCVLFAIRTDVSAACRFDVDMHQTLFLDGCWWVWHITTKYLVASGQVHILLLGMCIKFFLFFFCFFCKGK